MQQLSFKKNAVFIGLSKIKKKISHESQYCVKQIEGNIQDLNTHSLPPGQTLIIKNSQSFLLNSANLIVRLPCATVPPPSHFSTIQIPQF